ncbi:hypothetical protein D3C73_1479530 [compost metagenome]
MSAKACALRRGGGDGLPFIGFAQAITEDLAIAAGRHDVSALFQAQCAHRHQQRQDKTRIGQDHLAILHIQRIQLRDQGGIGARGQRVTFFAVQQGLVNRHG